MKGKSCPGSRVHPSLVWILDQLVDQGLQRTPLLIYLAILEMCAEKMSEQGFVAGGPVVYCTPTIQTLAERVGLEKRAVRYGLKNLRERRLLRVNHHKQVRARPSPNAPNSYVPLVTPPDWHKSRAGAGIDRRTEINPPVWTTQLRLK